MALAPSPATPATPITQKLPAANEAPKTGTWRHPRFSEISRRQNASSFTDRNVKTVLLNAVLLFGTWLLVWTAKSRSSASIIKYAAVLLHPLVSYSPYPIWALRLFLLTNILLAFYPLMRQPDDLADIPLTPTQRAQLGLNPTPTTPTTPSGQYITPPRYPRSATPQNGTPTSARTRQSNSPHSASGSPLMGRMQGGSPYSPTPLLQKAMGEGARRSSWGSPSPLGASYSALVGTPATPSPTSGKATGLGLSSRWLYERRRNSPGSPRLYN